MKFKVSMKDPDTLYDAINDALEEELEPLGLDEDESEAVADVRRGKIREVCSKWFRYGEYLTVEIDTEAETCTVVPC
jgi:hypothetical protein